MIHLTVTGLPAPQGSKTRMPNGAMVDGSSRTGRANLAAWRQAVRQVCRDHLDDNPGPPLAEPVRVALCFRFPPVKSDPYRHWVATKPDIDKLVRSTFDAMVQGGLLADDALVVALETRKTYASEWSVIPAAIGCTIDVIPLGVDEQRNRARQKSQAARARREAKAAS